MATFSTPEDFSDLGKSINFSYLGNKYTIPPIAPGRSKKLVRMSREIGEKAKKNEGIVKTHEELNQELPSEILDEMSDIFEFQVRFIVAAGIKRVDVNDQGEIVASYDVTKQEIENEDDGWSTQLVLKIFQRINEVIIGEQEKKA